jgi:hypothetical protein
VTRRDWLVGVGVAGAGASLRELSHWGLIDAGEIAPGTAASTTKDGKPKSVAAVVTTYRPLSHADVLVGRIVEGWRHQGGPGPALRLASLYLDQSVEGDLGRRTAAKYAVPICKTIEEAITLGSGKVAVDGVISVGEHGTYPHNAKDQHLYPRRRFFSEIIAAFRKYGRVVPVFSDKHLGPVWEEALWMYETARAMQVPFMAGSSLPVTYRDPDVSVPMGTVLEGAVGIGYGDLDAYGFHTIEAVQSFVERRRGGETGVKSVRCLTGEAMWRALDGGEVPQDLLEAALRVTPKAGAKPLKGLSGNNVALYQIEYQDRLPAAVLMLNGFATGFGVAVRQGAGAGLLAARIDTRTEPYYPHFAFLLKAIEQMVETGRPAYPVERTLLTSGILDRALTSRHEGGRRIETPELAIRYKAVEYPHAPEPKLPL